MISGIVKDGHATVNVEFRLPNLPDFTIEFVIDTGFTDYLCLPSEAVVLLGLPFLYELPANLADNSWIDIPVHEAVIIWNGEERVVNVVATGKRPLLGTALKTHKLSGKLKDLWSFSLDYGERVVFYFADDGDAVFVDIGSHDEVY